MTFKNPKDSIARGIGMVHQHFQLVPVLSVVDNVMLGDESIKNGLLDRKLVAKRITELSIATAWRSIPTPSSKICRWACASAWRSSRRSTATPTF